MCPVNECARITDIAKMCTIMLLRNSGSSALVHQRAAYSPTNSLQLRLVT